jgi:hypothetical protein
MGTEQTLAEQIRNTSTKDARLATSCSSNDGQRYFWIGTNGVQLLVRVNHRRTECKNIKILQKMYRK